MRVLVTGGAGYIGSFMVRRLLSEGVEVIILDTLERGDLKRVPEGVTLIKGSLLDPESFKDAFEKPLDGIFHFAAYISVGESTKSPGMYFKNNVEATVNLLEAMCENNVSSIVFSSSAAVYGNPQTVPIPEEHAKNPESPYGESKLMVERILSWYGKTKNINSVSLRYFNASGASIEGDLGEAHQPETHIIPSVIQAVLENKPFTLFGQDYDTKDGTCVRDYINVLDLAQAHTLALAKIQKEKGVFAYNVGTGEGYSNREIINMIEEISGKKLTLELGPRRQGDPSKLIADPTKISEELGFKPQYSSLQTIISSAWKWHTANQ